MKYLQKEHQTFDFVSAAENHKVVLSRFELSTCRGESATGQLLIGEGFVRTARPPLQMT
jgi:hypothetical protein